MEWYFLLERIIENKENQALDVKLLMNGAKRFKESLFLGVLHTKYERSDIKQE